jgi:hypothetical protein
MVRLRFASIVKARANSADVPPCACRHEARWKPSQAALGRAAHVEPLGELHLGQQEEHRHHPLLQQTARPGLAPLAVAGADLGDAAGDQSGASPPPGLLSLAQRQAPHEAAAGFERPQEGLAGGDHLGWRHAHALLTAAAPPSGGIEAGRDGEELAATLGADQRAALEGVDDVRHLGEHQPRRSQRLPRPREDHRPPGIGDAAGIAAKGPRHLPAQLGLHLLGLGTDSGHGSPLARPHLIRQHL